MEKRKELILTAGPSITQKEISYVNDAVTNGWNNQWNKYIVKLEKKFAEYIGVKHAISTSSCTGAMHLALAGLGIKDGDEVIVPETTWIATAAVVTYLKAKPVFVDIERDSWGINPESIKSAITDKTKAIMPVHLYGGMAKMDEIMEISAENKLHVVEDAAPSLGATFNDKKSGSFGDAAAFSFQGAKIMTTGEGGMLLINDSKKFEMISKIADQGRSYTKQLWNDEIGLKYKISNIQAALGLAQLERLDDLVEKKREIFSWYYNRLKDIDGISLNYQRKNSRNTYWMTTIVLEKDFKLNRDQFMKKLKEWNVDCRPVFYPLSHMPMFETKHNQNAEWFGLRGVNLPSGHNLIEEDIEYICNVIKEILNYSNILKN